MPSTVSRLLTPAALFAAVLTALAQPVATARPDPLDPTAIAPPMAYGERGFHFNLARHLARPLITQVESRRFERIKSMVA